MKRLLHGRITANSELGRYKGVTYGIEDEPPMRYYFIEEDGSITYGETEDEIRDKIDISVSAR